MEDMTMHPTTKDNSLPAHGTPTIPNCDPAQTQQISLSQLKHNPYQPRNKDYREDLDELVESVRQYGVLQPVLVRQTAPEEYELIAGERRVSAALRAGLTSIPAILCNVTAQQSAEIALIENLQREDLSPVEMARAFRALMEDFKLTQQQIAQRVGKSRSTITHALRLLQLSDEILNSLDRGEIQEGHALTLLQVEDETLRERLFQQVRTEKLSKQELRQQVRRELGEATQPAPKKSEDRSKVRRAHLAQMSETALSDQLKKKFSRQVVIQCPHGKGGQVAMCFRNPEDMIALVDALLSVPV
jgi:ParB family transcriptional regulator, chromosome partitioning protein